MVFFFLSGSALYIPEYHQAGRGMVKVWDGWQRTRGYETLQNPRRSPEKDGLYRKHEGWLYVRRMSVKDRDVCHTMLTASGMEDFHAVH